MPLLNNNCSEGCPSGSTKSYKTSNLKIIKSKQRKHVKGNKRKSDRQISILPATRAFEEPEKSEVKPRISLDSAVLQTTACNTEVIEDACLKQPHEITSPAKTHKRNSYRALNVLVQKSPTKPSSPKQFNNSVTNDLQSEHLSKIEFLAKHSLEHLQEMHVTDSSCKQNKSVLLSKIEEFVPKTKSSSYPDASDGTIKDRDFINTDHKDNTLKPLEDSVVSKEQDEVSSPSNECSKNIKRSGSSTKVENAVSFMNGGDESDSFNSSSIRSFYDATFLSEEDWLTGIKNDLDTTCITENFGQEGGNVIHASDNQGICYIHETQTTELPILETVQTLKQSSDFEVNVLIPKDNANTFIEKSLSVNDSSTQYVNTCIAKNTIAETDNVRKRSRRKLYDSAVPNASNNGFKHFRRSSAEIDILPLIKEMCEDDEVRSHCINQNIQNQNVCKSRRISCDSLQASWANITLSPEQLSPAARNSSEKLTPASFKAEKVASPEEVTVTQILKASARRRRFWRRKSGSPETLCNTQKNSRSPSLCRILLESRINAHESTPSQKQHISPKSPNIIGITPSSSFGFEMSLINLQDVRAVPQSVNLTLMALEAHISTRGDLKPDPTYDPVQAFFYTVTYSVDDTSQQQEGIVAVNIGIENHGPQHSESDFFKLGAISCNVHFTNDERSLLQELVTIVKKWDPDILAGYEVEMLSWGYVFRRAFVLGINLCPEISRVPSAVKESRLASNDSEKEMVEFSPEIKLVGRIVLNIWRLLRHEVSVMSYTFENMMYHILHQRVPQSSFKNLTQWWSNRTHLYRWMTVEHYLVRVRGLVRMLDQLDLIGRTCELARLFGIQFFEVLSRGSQFRVESMMMRLAKPYNYVAVSPNIQQRAKMRAPEYLPLIMEPMSRFYTDPVIVLDFQSLYPSMMIAYNYCFSTCLGRVEELGEVGPFRFGCTQLKVNPMLLKKIENDINVSPCGVAYVNQNIRKGVLPQMLEEILETRLMVKKSMKDNTNNRILQRVLHSRQLGLKLIANVTYGYTSANFSGRMPCVEVGDSVVSKGRETLERAIKLVEATPKWDARVVYGDTDSLFVLVKGRSREEAFRIGGEIAEAVTQDNPKPVKLKLEKVYQPCILQTKKRYVGYMYESPNQETPVYDAKGIETVRRDGCPAVSKILKKCLCILFESHKTNIVKHYLERQFTKLLEGRFNLQDLIFAREYRGKSGYQPGACVPALELARSWLKVDRCAEPRIGERVPYVIVNGAPGLPLIRLVRSPYDLLNDPSLRINVVYYITRVIIPPLDRCFSLLGVDIQMWYNSMPRKCSIYLPVKESNVNKKSTISQYFATVNCAVCDEVTQTGLCSSCQQQPQKSAISLADKLRSWERNYFAVNKICQSCSRHCGPVSCMSLDCPVLFLRYQTAKDLTQAPFVRQLQEKFLNF